MPLSVDDTWAVDDFCRRIFQQLSTETVDERQQNKNRLKRQYLLAVLEGTLEGSAEKIAYGSDMLKEMIISARRDYSAAFDVVTTQPLIDDADHPGQPEAQPAYSTDAAEPVVTQIPKMVSL